MYIIVFYFIIMNTSMGRNILLWKRNEQWKKCWWTFIIVV
jgi:hypothetical protein